MIRDERTGWSEADITVNGRKLTFSESMAVRVAVGSFRMFVCDKENAEALGLRLAEGYDAALSRVEACMMEKSNG